jgi:hypothetical protein
MKLLFLCRLGNKPHAIIHIAFLFIFLATATSCASQKNTTGNGAVTYVNPDYLKTMEEKIRMIDSSFKPKAMQDLIADFERIAETEKSQWLPYYYAGMCRLMTAFMQRDKSKIDAIIDRAEYYVAKADSLSKENSEISCLKSMAKGARVMVDEQTRGMKYGMESDELIDEAKRLDPKNPRPYLLEAQSKMYTPEQYGGGKAKAKAALLEAKKRYAIFKPASSLHPNWGLDRVEEMLKELDK